MSATRPWLNGEPYYCEHCGAGGVERDMCEEPDCKLESKATAEKRRKFYEHSRAEQSE